MENEVIVLPPLEYKGQIVLTSKQLSDKYGCQRSNINENFRNHRANFIEGVDYFYLQGAELQNFKAQNPQGGYKSTSLKRSRFSSTSLTEGVRSETTSLFAFANSVNSLYLWTKSGALKHSHFLNTKKAREVFKVLSQAYFEQIYFGNAPTANNFTPPLNSPKIRKPKIKDSLDLETLKFLIDRAANENLRDELIRKAAGISEMPKCVYILAFENVLKIGITQDFQRRAREIISSTGLTVKNWCHTDKIPAEFAREIETALLEKFEPAKVDGEFFKVEFWAAAEELAKLEDVTDFQNIL